VRIAIRLQSSSNMKVLVVDASHEDRGRVADALGELTDFVVEGQVASLGGALRRLECSTPDLVVTDVQFPDGDGVGLIEAARRHDAAPFVVVFTSADSPEARQRCLAAGAHLFLVKDSDLQQLKVGVRELSELRRATLGTGSGELRVVGDDEAAAARAAAAEAADRFALLGRLAGGVAHDLNNYLAVIGLSLGAAERQARGNSAAEGALGEAKSALAAATRLTRHMLEHARGGTPTPTTVDLGALVVRTVELLRSSISQDVQVAVDASGELPPVVGVPAELEQLVLNLVLNACDAMPCGGELSISLRAAGTSTVTLDVADTGRGVDQDVARASGATSRSSKAARIGDGLGLGIVRAVVHRHGAALRMSPRTGGGTRVVVVFFVEATR
jgi:signal transduction histidine kinase